MQRFFMGGMAALLALVCAKFPVWGIIELERKLDVYPLVSHETIDTIDQMTATLTDFGDACEAHQLAERDLNYLADDPESLAVAGTGVEVATADMYTAVARRKALAAKVDWSLVKSMLIGGQVYTHSTWLCAPPYASFTTQINMGFAPTYDPA